MKLQRSLSVLVVFLVMSGNLLGSEPAKRLQVHWDGLGKVIGGKKVAVQLADGARVKGRVRRVEATSLTIKVKKSSNPVAYSKGRTEIPRETVSRIEVRNSNLVGADRQVVFGTVGTFAGTLIGSFAAVSAAGSDSGGTVAQGVAILAIPTTAAVLVYRALRPKGVTLIEILPDPTGEREPKPTNKNQSSSTTSSGEALALSLAEDSSAEQLRRQSRRAVMRQDLPLDLSSRPVHEHRSGTD